MTTIERFQVFWQHYPVRVGKLAAQRVFERQCTTDEVLADMLAALVWQKECDQWKRGYIPHPRTWLHQGRWLDEPQVPVTERFSVREIEAAKLLRSRLGGCYHEPRCGTFAECIEVIARAQRGSK